MNASAGGLDAIRQLLPAWVGFADLLIFAPGAFLVGALTCWAGARVAIGPVRRLRGASWIERARAAHPVAQGLAVAGFPTAIAVGLVAAMGSGPLAHASPQLLAFLVGIAAYLGGFAVRRRFAREIRERGEGFARDLRSELIGLLLLAPHLVLVLAMILLLKPNPGAGGAAVIALGVLGFGTVCRSGGLPLLRLLGWARPAPAGLERIVAEIAQRVGVRPAAVWVVPWSCANAAAFPLSGQLIFTEEIREALDDDELAAITAHELGHLSEPWYARLTRAFAVFALLPFGVSVPIVHAVGYVPALALLVGYWVLLFGALQVIRRLEVRADAVGHRHEGDPGTYARALEKLYRANLTPAVTDQRNRTHPDLYDRMLASGVEPSYPRPSPPSRMRTLFGVGLAMMCCALGTALLFVSPRLGTRLFDDRGRALVWTVAASGGRTGLLDLAVHRSLSEASEDAVALARAASEADPRDHHPPAYLATLLSRAGRCAQAEDALRVAESRVRSPVRRERCGWIAQARDSLSDCRRHPGAKTI
jgi:Zn-dependent protease with chaperone function